MTDANTEIKSFRRDDEVGVAVELVPRSVIRVYILGSVHSGSLEIRQEISDFAKAKGFALEVIRVSDFADLELHVTEPSPEPTSLTPKDVYRSVILMNEVRFHSDEGVGMSLDTYLVRSVEGKSTYDYVKELCERYGIKLYELSKKAQDSDVLNQIRAIVASR